MTKTILVTGASGFIGSALKQHLIRHKKFSVIGVGRSRAQDCYPLDLLDSIKLEEFLTSRKPDIIFHLAGGRKGDWNQMLASNVLTTASLLETIGFIPGYDPRVIIIGSAAEYGDVRSSRPITERATGSPTGYGLIKLMQTNLALYYASLGKNVLVARLFNILGPGIPKETAVGKFAQQITDLEKSKISLSLSVANLSAVRDFLDIRDICEALCIFMSKGKKGEVYNICSQRGIQMRELLNKMVKASHRPTFDIIEDKKMEAGVPYAVGSSIKIRKLSPWEPHYSLEQSIEDTLHWYRRKRRV